MNCTEVGELMQRNLDRDLGELELETLMTHLSDCAQCTVLFEKLTLLSGSLEQLPRVIPSISIVDAILPELERIDKEKRNSLIVAKQRRNRWLTSIGSIATAAAIVVLMVNLNGVPASNNSVSSDLAMKSNLQKDAGTEPAAEPVAASEEEADMAADSPMVVRTTETIGQYGSTSGEVKDQSGDDFNTSEEKQVVEGVSVDPTGSSIKKNISMEQPSDTIPHSFVPELTGSLKEKTDSLGLLNEHSIGYQVRQEVTGEATLPKYFSADERLYLQLEEHTLSVYETSSNQLVKQWELPQQGRFEFIEWDVEGKNFTFQVTDEAGATTSHTLELIEQQ